MGLHFRLISLLQPDVVMDSWGREMLCTGVEVDLYGQPCSMGMVSVMVRADMWIESSDVNVDFGTRGLQIIDIWNARVIRGGDGKSASATFRLHQQDGSWFGERKSAFGFAASGIISKLPTISCKLNKPFPRPPPPALPAPPPNDPISFRGDRAGCFLGGSAVFTHEPDVEPVLGWMHSFEVTVSLDKWQEGVIIILDFYGANLHQHPLKILSMDPEEAVHREDLTGHSVVMKLLPPSPARQFKVAASGGVEGMRALRCSVLQPLPPMPPAPPPPRKMSPSFPIRPLSPPAPPPPPEQETRAIVGRERDLSPPPVPSPSATLTEKKTEVYLSIYILAGALVMSLYASSKLWELRRCGKISVAALLLALNRRKVPVRGLLRRWSTSTTQAHAPYFSGSAAEASPSWSIDDQPIQVLLDTDGELHLLEVDMQAVTCIKDLQEAVADACADLEVDGDELGELVMQFEDEEGQFETVTNSLPFERVQRARQLQLVSRERAAAVAQVSTLMTRREQLDDEGARAGLTTRHLGLGMQRWPRLASKAVGADTTNQQNYHQLAFSNLD